MRAPESLQTTIDGRVEPVQAPLSRCLASSDEAPRLFAHAPSVRGQLALPTESAIDAVLAIAEACAEFTQASHKED